MSLFRSLHWERECIFKIVFHVVTTNFPSQREIVPFKCTNFPHKKIATFHKKRPRFLLQKTIREYKKNSTHASSQNSHESS